MRRVVADPGSNTIDPKHDPNRRRRAPALSALPGLRAAAVRRAIVELAMSASAGQGGFESRHSAKVALMLCCLFTDPEIDEAELRRELLAVAHEPSIAQQLVRIFATNPQLAARFDDVRTAAASALDPRSPPAAGVSPGD